MQPRTTQPPATQPSAMQPPTPQDLADQYRQMPTEQLLDRLRDAGGGQADAATQAVTEALAARQARFPDADGFPDAAARAPSAGERVARELQAESNASLAGFKSGDKAGKVELRFPGDGYLKAERSKFASRADLVAHLAQAFGVPEQAGGLRLSLKRTGKYQRLSRSGRPIFTFGDPILDLITDEHGWVTVGGETHHLLRTALSSPQARSGGVSTLDMQASNEEVRRQQVLEATSSGGARVLVEHTPERTVVASANPSELNFFVGSARMRFRSWKKNYVVYRSIGSEIETWGGDFTSARIESQYADPVVPANPFICGITKRDSDSDTNDDYVDEYEVGVFANPAGTVRSFCQARWKGQNFSGTVSKGDCQVML